MHTFNWFDIVIFAIAAGLGLGGSFFLWLLIGVAKLVTKERLMLLLLLGVGFIPVVTTILSPRQLSVGQGVQYIVSAVSQGGGVASWVSRLATFSIVALSVAMITRGWIDQPNFRRGGESLLLGFLAFLILGAGISAVAGTKPAFLHNMLYAPLVITAVYMYSSVSPEWMSTQTKKILLAYIYGSLIASVIFPGWALEPSYRGVIPGVDFRLVGLAGHSNGLAALALLYILLDIAFSRGSSWRLPNLVVSLAVLVISQSKTVWVAAIVCISIVLVCRMFSKSNQILKEKYDFGGTFLTAAGISVFSGILAVLAYLLFDQSIGFSEFDDSGVGTLTGRTKIWEITLDQWRSNPLFGYGPQLWDFEFRVQHDALAIGNAHNQFIETLGKSGIVGLLGLMIYIFLLIAAGFKHARTTNGLSVALLAILIIRSFTETPLSSLTIVDTTFFMHLFIFAFLQSLEKQRMSNLRK